VFLTTYGKALNKSAKYKEAIPVLQKANYQLSSVTNNIELGKSYQAIGNYENAEKAWTKASFMMPVLFTPHYLTAKMYNSIGETTKAKLIATNLLRKEVKIRSPELYEMLVEMDSIVNTKH
jgi:tetratricopeptide (TPR) repeat protein